MELRYTNTQEEVAEYIMFKRVNSDSFRDDVKRTQRMYYFMTGLVVLFSLFQLFRSNSLTDEDARAVYITQAFSMIIVGLFSFIFSRFVPTMLKFFNKREVNRELKKRGVSQPETVLNLDSNTLSWHQGKEKGTVKLTSEMWVVEKPEVYYLDTRKAFFVLPKRAFESESQKDEFVRIMHLEERIKKTAEAIKAK